MSRRAATAAALALVLATGAQAQERSARANYVLLCSGCHNVSGLGSEEGGIPAFPGSVGKIAAFDRGRTYMMHVPGVVSNSMSNAEIAAVMNYILDTWAPEAGAAPFTAEEVTARRKLPIPDIVVERREVTEELAAKGIDIATYPWP